MIILTLYFHPGSVIAGEVDPQPAGLHEFEWRSRFVLPKYVFSSQAVTVASSNAHTQVQRDERIALAQSSAFRSAGSEHYLSRRDTGGGAGVSVTLLLITPALLLTRVDYHS